MNHQNKHTDVKNASRQIKRAGALLTAAAGAMVVLLSSGTAAGQDANPGPATRPSMITDGVNSDGGVRLNAGKSAVITVKHPFAKLSVGSAEIADVNTVSPTSILVTAKKPGSTSLIIWDDQNRSETVDISVEQDLSGLRHQIKDAFPALTISVSPLNDTIALRGQVPAMQTAEQIVEMASTYGKVHNFLEISGGQQVMLQVRLAEVSKSALRNLGVTFGGTDGISSFTTNGIGSGTNTFNLGSTGGGPLYTATFGNSVQFFGQGRFGAISFDYFITALRTNNLLKDLAEPNLLTMSGQQATFLAGGQIPIPVPQPGNGGSTITIEYKDYGVSLNFTPQVLGNGRIRLLVNPDVSELDFSHSVSVAGTSVPGITKRTVQTTVELGDGQSFALAGLLQNDMAASNNSVPLLGDLPVLGNLFRSTSYQRSETELVVMVTPHLVAPMNPDKVPALPGEHWRYPSEAGQYLFADLGGPAVEKGKPSTDSKNAEPAPQFTGSYGFSAAGAGNTQKVSAP